MSNATMRSLEATAALLQSADRKHQISAAQISAAVQRKYGPAAMRLRFFVAGIGVFFFSVVEGMTVDFCKHGLR